MQGDGHHHHEQKSFQRHRDWLLNILNIRFALKYPKPTSNMEKYVFACLVVFNGRNLFEGLTMIVDPNIAGCTQH